MLDGIQIEYRRALGESRAASCLARKRNRTSREEVDTRKWPGRRNKMRRPQGSRRNRLAGDRVQHSAGPFTNAPFAACSAALRERGRGLAASRRRFRIQNQGGALGSQPARKGRERSSARKRTASSSFACALMSRGNRLCARMRLGRNPRASRNATEGPNAFSNLDFAEKAHTFLVAAWM